MKIKILVWAFLLIGVCACSKDDDIESIEFFEPLSSDTLWYGQAEASQDLALQASMQVKVEVAEDAANWCDAVISGSGNGQVVSVHCTAFDRGDMRSATLLLKTEQIERKLVVCQYGNTPVIKVVQPDFRLTLEASVIKVPVISNVDYEVVPGQSWIHALGIVKGNIADTVQLGIDAADYPRMSAEVLLKWKELSAKITVSQIGADSVYIPQSGNLITNKIKVKDGNASHNSPYLGFKYSYDGTTDGFNTSWIPVGEDLVMTWNFEQAEPLEQMIYYPQEKVADRCLGVFHLYVKEEGSTEYTDLGTHDLGSRVVVPSTFHFEKDMKKIESVRIRISAPQGTEGQWVFSCQEMEFYRPGFDVSSIFVDEICSALKEGVTYEQIMNIEDEFYRNIARYMFIGTYDTEFRIQEYKPYINPDVQSENHNAKKWSFLDNATGISVNAGEQVVLFVGEVGNEILKAQVIEWEEGTRFMVKPDDNAWVLKTGVNTFTAQQSGLLYIIYNPDDLNGKKPIKIHIPSGEVNGYFDIERHDNVYWKGLLDKAKYEYLDVKGKLTHLVFPVEDYRLYCPEDIERLLEISDSVVLLEHQLSGLYKYNRMYPNRILCKKAFDTDFSYWMYATDYHTGYHKDATNIILTADKLRGEWGFAHELGHVHQHKDITWAKMTEVSNNVFSMYVTDVFGGKSRLLDGNSYEMAYNLIAVTGIPYIMPAPNTEDLFSKLVPLWQLHLYFAKVLDKPEFYMDLYEEMRKEERPSCPQLNFVELCCQVGKTDLTDFFRFFGFFEPVNDNGLLVTENLVDQTLQNIQKLGLTKKAPAIQYLRDDNVTLFRDMKPIEKGRTSLSGSTLTLSGWKNVVAWEVYEGDQLIQVAVQNSFTMKNSSGRVKAVAADGSKIAVELP